MPIEPYDYTQDFESTDPVSAWASNGTYTENFKGLISKGAYSGTQVFELDVNFGTATYVYYKLPLTVPAEGNLRFSGRIRLADGTTPGCGAGLGANVYYFPTTRSACGPFATYSLKPNVWQLVEEDVVAWGKEKGKVVMGLCWEVTGANVGVSMSHVGVFLFGSPGKRIVVDIDDISLKGKVPSQADFQKEVKSRWAPAGAKIDAKVVSWTASLLQAEARIDAFADGDEKTKLRQQISVLKNTVSAIAKRGYILTVEVSDVDKQISRLLTVSPANAGS